MRKNNENTPSNFLKRWLITIGLFLGLQLLFYFVDGTSLEPNINDSDNLFATMGRWMLNSKLFTEWIHPYTFPFFNMLMTIHIVTILIQAINDMLTSKLLRKKRVH